MSLQAKTTEIIIGGARMNVATFFLPCSVITNELNLLHCYGTACFVVILHRFPSRAMWGIPGCGFEEAVLRGSRDPVVGKLEADMLAKPWLRGSRLKAGPGFCTPCEAVLDGIQLGEARVCELTCFLATSGRVTGKQTESYRRIGGTVGRKCCSGWQRPAFFSSECEKHLVSPSQTCLRCSSRTRRLWSA